MDKKVQYYESILKKSQALDYLRPARQTIRQLEANLHYDFTLVYVTALVTAPVLLSYTAWVLFDARKRGLRRLYFLARDGYVMYKMAKMLRQAWRIDIECRYFYCSRYALRMPVYLFARDYALDRIFDLGLRAHTTALTVLLRAGIKNEEAINILSEIGWPIQQRLNASSINTLRMRLLNDSQFDRFAVEAAEKAYKPARSYFMQECGDTELISFGLVDSGWLGSMQECFCRMYNHIFDKQVQLDGYYFGMFGSGNPRFGKYHCWFFSPDDHFHRVRYFNNNVFECLCAADHGMTVGYDEFAGTWRPIFNQEADYGHAAPQLSICEAFTKLFVEHNPSCYEISPFDEIAFLLLKGLMTSPSQDEAGFYGGLKFSDDVTGTGLTVLARPLSLSDYFGQSIYGNLIKIIFKKDLPYEPVFWLDGAVALSKFRLFVKLDMFLYRLAKYWWLKRKARIKNRKNDR